MKSTTDHAAVASTRAQGAQGEPSRNRHAETSIGRLGGLLTPVIGGLLAFTAQAVAQDDGGLEKAGLKPYVFFPYASDSPEDHGYGEFHYTNVHETMPEEMVGRYYQSGLFHTWLRPASIYGPKDFDKKRDGYHTMEGGAGYKPYLRFQNPATPFKFTTGAVAGGFGSYSNGPGQGTPPFKRTQKTETLGWEKNTGRYGAAQLSNHLLYPLDGIGFKEGTNNEMLGYGYYALPLTDPKKATAGTDAPSGNHCWTLFFNTKNFAGPICFFTPYHWSKYSIRKPHLHGRCLDSSLIQVNARYQRETNKIPAKKWTAANGDVYYRVAPYLMAADEDGVGRYGSSPMTLDGAKWDEMVAWFSGKGDAASTSFGSLGKEIHARKAGGPRLAYKIDDTPVDSTTFTARFPGAGDSVSAVSWHGDLIRRVKGKDLIRIPEYYRLTAGMKKIDAISAAVVPKESGLHDVRFPDDAKEDYTFPPVSNDALRTPLHPEYTYRDEVVNAWYAPGPVEGPFVTKLDDGSQVVYYWYKFNEQPAILNSHMDEAERQTVQARVEAIHREWSEDDRYFPDPKHPLAALDPGLLVTPPEGLGHGYVPICVHQALATDELPEFEAISRR